MPKTHPIQNSFSRGELSPLMNGRSDTEVYDDGVKVLRNMYADSRGAAKTRESLSHILTLVAGTKAKIETYNRDSSEFFMIIITHLEMRFIRNILTPQITLFTAPWTVDQVEDIYFVPTPDGRVFYMLHPDVQPQKLSDAVGTTITTEFLVSGNFTVPAGITSLDLCVAGGGGGGGGSDSRNGLVSAGGGGGGSGVVKTLAVSTPGEAVPVVVGNGGIGGAGSDGSSTPTNGGAGGASSVVLISTSVVSLGGAGGNSAAGQTSGLGGLGSNGGGNGGKGSSRATGVLSEPGGDCTFICGGSSFTGGISLPNVDRDVGGGGGAGGFGNGGAGGTYNAYMIPPSDNSGAGGGGLNQHNVTYGTSAAPGGSGKVVIKYTTSASGLTFAPVAFTNAPITWVGTNWPSCGTYHQSRLWLAGEPDNGETFYASKSGELEDFDLGTGLDNEGLSFILENFGRIEWMIPAKQLLIGTLTGEYVVSSQGGVITTDDIQVDQQGSYGSASIQPVKIGDQVVFVTPDRRKIRAMNYDRNVLNWMSNDLTLPSEHITKGLIKDLSWAQHPNNLLWVTLDDGTMACLSYERGDNIYGWHRHDTQGKILGTGSGFNGVKNVLVAAVERTAGLIELEALNDNHYVDSWIQTSVFTPYTNSLGNDYFYIEGFDHLDGRAIQVTIDGVVHPDLIVKDESDPGEGDGAAGRLYLDFNGSVAVAGLSYTPELTTLDLDGGSQTGSGAAHKKRYNKIYVDVLGSGLPLINGSRGNDRNSTTPMDSKEKLITGTIEAVNSSDWDRFAHVNIKQDLPLPLVILKIYGEVQKNSF